MNKRQRKKQAKKNRPMISFEVLRQMRRANEFMMQLDKFPLADVKGEVIEIDPPMRFNTSLKEFKEMYPKKDTDGISMKIVLFDNALLDEGREVIRVDVKQHGEWICKVWGLDEGL